jgi:hypothetical protein
VGAGLARVVADDDGGEAFIAPLCGGGLHDLDVSPSGEAMTCLWHTSLW